MKIKNKFLDVTLDDLTLGDAKPFDVSGTDVAGKKVFTSMPKTTGTTENMNDAATWAYLQTRKENVKGDAELLVLPILQKDIDAKGITFEYPVASGLYGSVMVQILHGPELARDMDFTLMANGAGISWDGYALDGRLEVGDVLVVAYKRGPMWETVYIYVADVRENSLIQKFNDKGTFIGQWGGYWNWEWPGDPFAGSGMFSQPRGMAVDSVGNVYVADTENHRVQTFDAEGNFLFMFGGYTSSYELANGKFGEPVGVAIDSSGNIYVTDSMNYRVQKFDSNGQFLLKWGAEGSGDGCFGRPYGISVAPDGSVYVSDELHARIQKFTPTGEFLLSWGNSDDVVWDEDYINADGHFGSAYHLAIDKSGNVYVADGWISCVHKFDSNGNFLMKWGSYGNGNGQFQYIDGIAIDSSGYIYTSDPSLARIQKFDANGNFVLSWGSKGAGEGEFDEPAGIACFPRPF